MKDKTTAIILSILLGGLGVDRFYLGYTGMGVLKLLTGGVFGIMWIIDIINIVSGNLKPADGSDYADSMNGGSNSTSAYNPYDDLKKYSELKEQGILSEEEYQKLKADCLAKIK